MNILVDKLKKNSIPFKVVGGTVVITGSKKAVTGQMAIIKEIDDMKAKIAKLKKKYKSDKFKYELEDLDMFNKSQLMYLNNLKMISDEDYNKVK